MEAFETFEVDGLRVSLHSDDDPESPREWDNCAVLACEHRHYNLGDGTLADAIGRTPDEFKSLRHLERYLTLAHGAVVVVPLYLYDHSGISMSTGSFIGRAQHAEWDSGMVGIAWITRDVCEREFNGDVEAARKCLEGEVETYDQYLTGDVWGYVVETPAGDHLDSLWGIYGLDYCRTEAESAARSEAAQETAQARWAAVNGIATVSA